MTNPDTRFKGETFSEERINFILEAIRIVNNDEIKKRGQQGGTGVLLPNNIVTRVAVQNVIKKVLSLYKNIDNESYLRLLKTIISLKENYQSTSDVILEEEINSLTGKSINSLEVLLDEASRKRLSTFVKRDHCSITEAMDFIHSIVGLVEKGKENSKSDNKNNSNMAKSYVGNTIPLLYELILGQQIAGKNGDNLREYNEYIAKRTANSIQSMPMIFVPTMLENFNENPNEGLDKIKKFIAHIENHDLDSAAKCFDINLQNEESCLRLIENFQKFIVRYKYNGRVDSTKIPMNISKHFSDLAWENNKEELEWYDRLGSYIAKRDDGMSSIDSSYTGKILSYADINKKMKIMYNLIKNKERETQIKRGQNTFGTINAPDEKDFLSFINSDKAFQLTMEFFSDFDEELFKEIIQLLVDGKVYIYSMFDKSKEEQIKSGELKDRLCHTMDGIYYPLLSNMSEELYNRSPDVFGNKMAWIIEMYAFVHELGHELDMPYNRIGRFEKDSFQNWLYNYIYGQFTRRGYLAETTAILFEHLFGDFLIKKDSGFASIDKEVKRQRLKSTKRQVARLGYAAGIANVYKTKENGRELKDYLQEVYTFYFRDNNESIFKDVHDNQSMYEYLPYVLALIIVPTFMKTYREDTKRGKEMVLNYIKHVKQNDFDGAMASLGIDLTDEKQFKTLCDNFYEYMKEQEIEPTKEKTLLEFGGI